MNAMSAPILPSAFDRCIHADLLDARDRHEAAGDPAETTGFVAGTRVATPMGYVAVERLSPGDRVLTADGRHSALASVAMTCLPVTAATAPVRFDTGVMDNMRPLRLGQGQRVRVSGWRAELIFDAPALLSGARAFVNGEDVVIEDAPGEITFVQLICERPEIVLAENIACETLSTLHEAADRFELMDR
jgi:hypothetical protein